MDTNNEYGDLIRERFAKLPKVVQDAITSADVSAHMRQLAETHKLHLDQWGSLENEVHLTLLGAEPAEDLAKNIQSEVNVDAATASALAADIFKTVFEPIRVQLERELEHKDSVAAHDTSAPAVPAPSADASPIPAVATATAPAAAQPAAAPQAAVSAPAPALPPTAPAQVIAVPATPPAAAPTAKVERAPLSSTYAASQPSHERKAIEGDPYREPIA